jgi:hypothetical protein
MRGDSSIPPLSQRVPGATKRPTPETLIAPPMLPRSLLERLRAELRAELSEAQAREEPGPQLPPARPEQPVSVPLPVPEAADGRPGRAKRRLLRDSKPRRPFDSDVTPAIPIVTAFAKTEAPSPAATTINGLAALAATDLAQQTTARPLPQPNGRRDPERAPATADVPRMPTPPEMAKAAAALLAPYPEDITQPIPVIGAVAQDEVVGPATMAVNGRSDLTATDPKRHAKARPLAKRARPPDQMPPAVNVPMMPMRPEMPPTVSVPMVATRPELAPAADVPVVPARPELPPAVSVPMVPARSEMPPVAASVPARHPEDITQPIPVVRADAVTEVLSQVAKTVNAQPGPSAIEAAPPDQAAKTPADREKRTAARAAQSRRQRPERRRGNMPAAPPLDADQLIRPLFADSGRFDEGTVDQVVASVRAQRDWRKAQAGWLWFLAPSGDRRRALPYAPRDGGERDGLRPPGRIGTAGEERVD